MSLTQDYVNKIQLESGQIEVFDQSFEHAGSFGLRVSYGGRKSYFYNYIIAGKRQRITIGQHPTISLEQARKEAGKLAYRVFLGQDPKSERKILGKAHNFSALTKWFVEDSSNLASSTLTEYERIIKKELEPYLGHRSPGDIESEDINLLIRKIGAGRNRKTLANRTRALLHRIFEFAVEQGVLRENPVSQSKGYLIPANTKNLLTLIQLKKIWQSLDLLINPSLSGMFKILMLSAQSAKQIQCLKWSDLRLDYLHLSSSLPLALSSQSIQILKTLRFPNGKHEYVFGNLGLQHYSTMQRNFKKAVFHSKLDQDCNLEILRRSIEMQLRRMGINHFVVSYIMQNKTEVERLKGLKALNIQNDVKSALEAWSKLLTTEKNTKVIQLFPS